MLFISLSVLFSCCLAYVRVNNPSLPLQYFKLGSGFSYTFPSDTFVDTNNDPISYSVVEKPQFLTFDPDNRLFSSSETSSNYAGIWTMKIFASSQSGDWTSSHATLKVHVLLPSVVAYLPLGTDFLDYSGNGLDMGFKDLEPISQFPNPNTENLLMGQEEGVYGKSFFWGALQQVRSPTGTIPLDGEFSEFTLHVWVKFADLNKRGYISQREPRTGFMYDGSSARVEYEWPGDGTTRYTETSTSEYAFPSGDWIAITLQKTTGSICTYLENGVEVHIQTLQCGFVPFTMSPAELGKDLQAYVQQFSFYSKVLTADEYRMLLALERGNIVINKLRLNEPNPRLTINPWSNPITEIQYAQEPCDGFQVSFPANTFVDALGNQISGVQYFASNLPEWLSFDPDTRTFAKVVGETCSFGSYPVDLHVRSASGDFLTHVIDFRVEDNNELAYYPFDSNLLDKATKNIHNVVSFTTDIPQYRAGKVNKGISLRGYTSTTEYDALEIPVSTLHGLGEYSIFFWARLHTLTHTQTIVSAYGSAENSFTLRFNPTTTNVEIMEDGGTQHSFAGVTFELDVWESWAITRALSGSTYTITLYRNGIAVDSYTMPDSIGTLIANGAVIVGQNQNDLRGGYRDSLAFEGDLDELRFFGTAQSASQIRMYHIMGKHQECTISVSSSAIPLQYALAESLFDYTFPVSTTFVQELGESLTYSVGETFPSWLSIDPATARVWGTASNYDVGEVNIIVYANDGHCMVSHSFRINVLLSTHSPLLFGYYTFDGGDFGDLSPAGNDPKTLLSLPNYVSSDGVGSSCASFDGSTSDRIDLPYDVIQNSQDFTVSFMVKSRDLTRIANAIVGERFHAFAVEVLAGESRVVIDEVYYSISAPHVEDKWYAGAFVRRGSVLHYFEDGIELGSVACTSANIVLGEKFQVGQSGPFTDTKFKSTHALFGFLDELRFYKRALSNSEIALLQGYLNCDPGCEVCSNDVCTKCVDGSVLLDGTCVVGECNAYGPFFERGESGICTECGMDNCHECEDDQTCILCEADWYLQGALCTITKCGDYFSIEDEICSGVGTCTGPGVCVCDSDLHDPVTLCGTCKNELFDYNDATLSCGSCVNKLLEYTNTACTSCQNDLFEYDVSTCTECLNPRHEYAVSSCTVCENELFDYNADPSCEACLDPLFEYGVTACTTCINPYQEYTISKCTACVDVLFDYAADPSCQSCEDPLLEFENSACTDCILPFQEYDVSKCTACTDPKFDYGATPSCSECIIENQMHSSGCSICKDNYFNFPACDEYKCGEFWEYETNFVCSGIAPCVGYNECDCTGTGWGGPNCEFLACENGGLRNPEVPSECICFNDCNRGLYLDNCACDCSGVNCNDGTMDAVSCACDCGGKVNHDDFCNCHDGWTASLCDVLCADSRCRKCSASGVECYVPFEGYFVAEGDVFPCPNNCFVCSSETSCTEAAVGYFINNGIVEKCPDNCDECSAKDQCLVASSGYYVDDGLVKLCQLGCSVCLDSLTCTEAMYGYYLDGFTLKKCHELCLRCLSETVCTKPVLRYFIDMTFSPQPCTANCLVCVGEGRDECQKADDGYYLATVPGEVLPCELHCLKCLSGTECLIAEERFYVTQSGSVNHCMVHCELCEDFMTCRRAEIGYFVNSENSVSRCMLACEFCTDSNSCTKASRGFFLDEDGQPAKCVLGCDVCENELQCVEAQSGWYIQKDTGVPKLCSITHCSKCLDENVCVKAASGFYLDENSYPVLCPSHCISCDSANVCLEAEMGYFLESYTPVKCADNCVRCRSSTVCLEAGEGYFADNTGTVHQCIENCRVCFSGNGCELAEKGFWIDRDQTPIQIIGCNSNCQECIGSSNSDCLLANEGWFIGEDSVIRSCTGSCLACNNLEYCLKAGPGFYLNNGILLACAGHCSECIDSSICTSVTEAGWYLDGIVPQQCILEGCLECISAEVCTVADHRYEIEDGIPVLKYSCDENCARCRDTCEIPKTGYYVKDDHILLPCREYCKSCSDGLTCLTAVGGFYVDSETSLPKRCEPGCARCTSYEVCIHLEKGFYRSEDGIALRCEPGCKTCEFNVFYDSVLCTEPEISYYIDPVLKRPLSCNTGGGKRPNPDDFEYGGSEKERPEPPPADPFGDRHQKARRLLKKDELCKVRGDGEPGIGCSSPTKPPETIGCAACHNPEVCYEALPGYYLVDKQPRLCDPLCKVCDGNLGCLETVDDQYYVDYLGNVVRCHHWCRKCVTDGFGPKNVCKEPIPGKRTMEKGERSRFSREFRRGKDDDHLRPIPMGGEYVTDCDTSCPTCLSRNWCTSCVKGKYLKEGRCVTCSNFIHGCTKCDPDGNCLDCQAGLALKPSVNNADQMVCSLCGGNCDMCDYRLSEGFKCQICSPGYVLKPGIVVQGRSYETCQWKCASKSCLECKDDNLSYCTKCKERYNLVTDTYYSGWYSDTWERYHYSVDETTSYCRAGKHYKHMCEENNPGYTCARNQEWGTSDPCFKCRAYCDDCCKVCMYYTGWWEMAPHYWPWACFECMEGYQLQGNYKCSKKYRRSLDTVGEVAAVCSEEFEQCEACVVDDLDETLLKCTSCSEGFGLKDGACVPCPMEGCLQCDFTYATINGECVVPQKSWRVVAADGTCVPCSDSRCETCIFYEEFGDEVCIGAMDGFWLDDEGILKACVAGCEVCIDGESCLVPLEGFVIQWAGYIEGAGDIIVARCGIEGDRDFYVNDESVCLPCTFPDFGEGCTKRKPSSAVKDYCVSDNRIKRTVLTEGSIHHDSLCASTPKRPPRRLFSMKNPAVRRSSFDSLDGEIISMCLNEYWGVVVTLKTGVPSLYMWGEAVFNDHILEDSETPVRIPTEDWEDPLVKSVACTRTSVFVLTETGMMYSMGQNSHGEILGGVKYSDFVQATNNDGVVFRNIFEIATSYHSLYLSLDELVEPNNNFRVVSIGGNEYGELGNENVDSSISSEYIEMDLSAVPKFVITIETTSRGYYPLDSVLESFLFPIHPVMIPMEHGIWLKYSGSEHFHLYAGKDHPSSGQQESIPTVVDFSTAEGSQLENSMKIDYVDRLWGGCMYLISENRLFVSGADCVDVLGIEGNPSYSTPQEISSWKLGEYNPDEFGRVVRFECRFACYMFTEFSSMFVFGLVEDGNGFEASCIENNCKKLTLASSTLVSDVILGEGEVALSADSGLEVSNELIYSDLFGVALLQDDETYLFRPELVYEESGMKDDNFTIVLRKPDVWMQGTFDLVFKEFDGVNWVDVSSPFCKYPNIGSSYWDSFIQIVDGLSYTYHTFTMDWSTLAQSCSFTREPFETYDEYQNRLFYSVEYFKGIIGGEIVSSREEFIYDVKIRFPKTVLKVSALTVQQDETLFEVYITERILDREERTGIITFTTVMKYPNYVVFQEVDEPESESAMYYTDSYFSEEGGFSERRSYTCNGQKCYQDFQWTFKLVKDSRVCSVPLTSFNIHFLSKCVDESHADCIRESQEITAEIDMEINDLCNGVLAIEIDTDFSLGAFTSWLFDSELEEDYVFRMDDWVYLKGSAVSEDMDIIEVSLEEVNLLKKGEVVGQFLKDGSIQSDGTAAGFVVDDLGVPNEVGFHFRIANSVLNMQPGESGSYSIEAHCGVLYEGNDEKVVSRRNVIKENIGSTWSSVSGEFELKIEQDVGEKGLLLPYLVITMVAFGGTVVVATLLMCSLLIFVRSLKKSKDADGFAM